MFTSNPAAFERQRFHRRLATAAGLALGLLATASAKAEDTIKVGILHSLSGTTAISKTTLKNVEGGGLHSGNPEDGAASMSGLATSPFDLNATRQPYDAAIALADATPVINCRDRWSSTTG